MSCDSQTLKELEASIDKPAVKEEEVEAMYNNSSLKFKYQKPYKQLPKRVKSKLRSIATEILIAKMNI